MRGLILGLTIGIVPLILGFLTVPKETENKNKYTYPRWFLYLGAFTLALLATIRYFGFKDGVEVVGIVLSSIIFIIDIGCIVLILWHINIYIEFKDEYIVIRNSFRITTKIPYCDVTKLIQKPDKFLICVKNKRKKYFLEYTAINYQHFKRQFKHFMNKNKAKCVIEIVERKNKKKGKN